CFSTSYKELFLSQIMLTANICKRKLCNSLSWLYCIYIKAQVNINFVFVCAVCLQKLKVFTEHKWCETTQLFKVCRKLPFGRAFEFEFTGAEKRTIARIVSLSLLFSGFSFFPSLFVLPPYSRSEQPVYPRHLYTFNTKS